MKKNFTWLLYVAIALTVLPLAFYVYHLGIKLGLPLSSVPSDWGAFGDYIGGILGPVYASLAFVAVLMTVSLQNDQIVLQNQQIMELDKRGHLDELQRLLASCSKGIDDRLDSKPSILAELFKDQSHASSCNLAVMLRSTGLMAILPPHSTDSINVKRQSTIHRTKEALGYEFADLATQYHQLVWCLLRFDEFGGGIMLDAYYKNRHQGDVCYLHALGYFSEGGRTVEYFDPVANRPNLIPENHQDLP